MQRVHQLPTDPDFVQDPYPFYDRLRAAGDLVWWEDYDMPVAAGYSQVKALLKNRKLGREAPTGFGPAVPDCLRDFYALDANSMLELDPPRHTRLRGLVLRAFTSARIAALEDGIARLCHQLIDAFPADGPVDLIEAYAKPVPVITIARLLGVPEDMADQLLSWSNAMVAMYQAGVDRAGQEAANTAAQEFTAYLRGYVMERRKAPAEDLISELITAEEDGEKLNEDELIATCILLLNAGHEATALRTPARSATPSPSASSLFHSSVRHTSLPFRSRATTVEVPPPRGEAAMISPLGASVLPLVKSPDTGGESGSVQLMYWLCPASRRCSKLVTRVEPELRLSPQVPM